MNHPFQAFVELISLDQEIRAISHEIIQRQRASEQYHIEQQALVGRLHQFKQHEHELRKQVDALELEMKTVDLQEQEQKARLEKVRNAKEHHAIKKEIERCKRTQHETELLLLSTWSKLESAHKTVQEQQQLHDTKEAELLKHIHEAQEAIAALRKKLAAKQAERAPKEVGIPQEWLEKYSHMRLHVEDPVVPVDRSACSACFYMIPNQELIRLHRRALVQCKGCFRLLYAPEAMNTQETNESRSI